MPEALSLSTAAAIIPPAARMAPLPAAPIGAVAEFPINELTLACESFPAFKDRLRALLGREVYDSWCASLRLESMGGGKLVFSVPTRFLQNWLQTHYVTKILTCWQEDHPAVSQVQFVVRSATVKAPAKPPVQIETKRPVVLNRLPIEKPAVPENQLTGSSLDPRLTFDHFVVGKSNRLAHTAATLAATGDDTPNPLYIHAGVGQGKSHLLQAIAHSKKSTLYVSAEHFIYSFLTSIKSNSPEFKNALRSIDTLLIDDIQFLRNKNTVSDLALVLNSLIDSGRQVVIAGDREPAHLENIDDRLKSRLMGGLCIEIAPPDQETRRGILEMRLRFMQAQTPAFSVPPEVLDHMATSLTANGRDLEGALNQLLVHFRAGSPIALDLAETVVQQLVQNQPPRRIKIEDIQKAVARHFNISKEDMISSRRTAQVVRPRQIAIYLAKTLTLRSLPEIGRRFGGRDHTTILHAVRKIEALLLVDTAMAKDVEEIRGLLAA